MTDLKFRGADGGALLSYREWMRKKLPKHWVIEDLDLVLRRYGEGDDATGRFALMECKYGENGLTPGQKNTFGSMHRLLRSADPEWFRYRGFYLGIYDGDCWEHGLRRWRGIFDTPGEWGLDADFPTFAAALLGQARPPWLAVSS